jgi:plasmid stabilization system protein ParE
VLEWRETARADLLAIVDYISDDNPDAAQQWPPTQEREE